MTENPVTVEDAEQNSYIDIRDIHPDWELMKCWNCGHTERIAPNQHMRVCHNCFMDNSPTDVEGEDTVKGPDDKTYVDYRLVWYGDISIEEAKRKYKRNTKEASNSIRKSRARNREVSI